MQILQKNKLVITSKERRETRPGKIKKDRRIEEYVNTRKQEAGRPNPAFLDHLVTFYHPHESYVGPVPKHDYSQGIFFNRLLSNIIHIFSNLLFFFFH